MEQQEQFYNSPINPSTENQISVQSKKDVYWRILVIDLVLFFSFLPLLISVVDSGDKMSVGAVFSPFLTTLSLLTPALVGSLALCFNFYSHNWFKKNLLVLAFNLIGIVCLWVVLTIIHFFDSSFLGGISESYFLMYYPFILLFVFFVFLIINIFPTRFLYWVLLPLVIIVSTILYTQKMQDVFNATKQNLSNHDIFNKLENEIADVNARVDYCSSITISERKSSCFTSLYRRVYNSSQGDGGLDDKHLNDFKLITPENLKILCQSTTYRYLDVFTHKDEHPICPGE